MIVISDEVAEILAESMDRGIAQQREELAKERKAAMSDPLILAREEKDEDAAN